MAGGRKPTVSDEEILRFFYSNSDPAIFTGEVADEFGLTNQGILPRLNSLEGSQFLESKKRGPWKIWWLTDEGRRYLDDLDE